MLGVVSPAALASPTSLQLPQSAAFTILGHWCGGIQERAFATGFATSGYPMGDVYISTTCNGSGRGGHSTTYAAWVKVTWDFTGAVVSDEQLSSAPMVSATFSAFDAHGNEIYNQSNHAYLALAAGYVPGPRLLGISLASGPATGGSSVAITGTGFTGATAVNFGSTPAASFTVNDDTSITAVSPPESAGTTDVTVTTPGGTSTTSSADLFTFIAAPSVLSVSPSSGTILGGTSVTITGTSFTTASAVYFGETGAGFTVNSDSSITATAPAGEAIDTVDVTVANQVGVSANSPADQFDYVAETPAPQPATCALSSSRNGRITAGQAHSSSRPLTGSLQVELICDQPATVELVARLSDTVRSNAHRKARTKHYRLAAISVTVQAHVVKNLKLELPSVAVADLHHAARQSLAVTLVASNGAGSRRSHMTISPLRL